MKEKINDLMCLSKKEMDMASSQKDLYLSRKDKETENYFSGKAMAYGHKKNVRIWFLHIRM